MLDPHLAWEAEWLDAWEECRRVGENHDEAAQQILRERCDAILAKIMATAVRTPQGAAVQLRIAMEKQLDMERWLPHLPTQLDGMAT